MTPEESNRLDTLVVQLPATQAELEQSWAHYMAPMSWVAEDPPSPVPIEKGDDLVWAWVARQWAEYRLGRGLRVDVDLEVRAIQDPPANVYVTCDACKSPWMTAVSSLQDGSIRCLKCGNLKGFTVDLRQTPGTPPRFEISTDNFERWAPRRCL